MFIGWLVNLSMIEGSKYLWLVGCHIQNFDWKQSTIHNRIQHGARSSLLLLLLCSSVHGGSTSFFWDMICICDHFPFLWHLGSYIPSSKVDLLCVVFSCTQAMVWLPVLGIFNRCTYVYECNCKQGLYKHCKCLHSKLSLWERCLCCIRESNLHEQCARPDARHTEPHTNIHTSKIQFCYLEVIEHDACAENIIIHTNQMGQRGVQDNPYPFFPQLQVLLLLFTLEWPMLLSCLNMHWTVICGVRYAFQDSVKVPATLSDIS